MHQLGVDRAGGNMEGKEVRFGIFNSALFATITTDASCGAVNAMHDSFTPLGGFVPLFNIQLGEIIFGGVGSGLYGMILFIVLAVFIAGLMVGRTPEYIGKKIEAYDVKVASIAILLMAFSILGFSGWAVLAPWGQAGTNNSGPHGLSEIFYAYSSCTGNNGSAFAGLTANPTNGDPHYDITLALATMIGRFGMIIPVMALAGSLGRKKLVATGAGTFPVTGALVCNFTDRHHPAGRRLNLLTRVNSDADSGAFPDAKRKTLLSDRTIGSDTDTDTDYFLWLLKLIQYLIRRLSCRQSGIPSRSSTRSLWPKTRYVCYRGRSVHYYRAAGHRAWH